MTASRQNIKQTLKALLIPALLIVAFVLIGLFGIRLYLLNFEGKPSTAIAIGEKLPDFSLTRLDGSLTPLSSISHKVALINFWATWCDACMAEMPDLVKLQAELGPKGLQLIAINLDESPSQVVPQVMETFKINFPIFTDPQNKIAELFNVQAIPLSVILNSEHKILWKWSGELKWNSPDFRKQLDQWLGP
jgi:thiol-disulfide isomerase/thioredoxin